VLFKQIKVRNISEEVFEQIKSAIENEELKPGSKLPTERELVKQLGVSRVPIREALKLLANVGLIETRQGGGSYVCSALKSRVQDPLDMLIKNNTEKLFELVEVRKEIETWAAYYAAKNVTPQQLSKLKGITDEMKQYFDQGKMAPYNIDVKFHLVIAQSASNTIRAHLLHTIQSLFSDYLRVTIETICHDRTAQQKLFEQHLEIYEAIRSHDPEGAWDAIDKHLTFVRDALKAQLNPNKEIQLPRGKAHLNVSL
jgi:GntR family transcriptional repressor for pyruvate dehydrogenase complex